MRAGRSLRLQTIARSPVTSPTMTPYVVAGRARSSVIRAGARRGHSSVPAAAPESFETNDRRLRIGPKHTAPPAPAFPVEAHIEPAMQDGAPRRGGSVDSSQEVAHASSSPEPARGASAPRILCDGRRRAGLPARPEGAKLSREPARRLARPERAVAGRPAAARPGGEAPLHARARDRDLHRAFRDLDRVGALEDRRQADHARDRPGAARGGAAGTSRRPGWPRSSTPASATRTSSSSSSPGSFDFVFSDADKDWYTQYFKDVDPKFEVGGCFTAHNVTRRGGGAAAFLDYVKALPNYDDHGRRQPRRRLDQLQTL